MFELICVWDSKGERRTEKEPAGVRPIEMTVADAVVAVILVPILVGRRPRERDVSSAPQEFREV